MESLSPATPNPLCTIADERHPIVVVPEMIRLVLQRFCDLSVDVIASQEPTDVSGKKSLACLLIEVGNVATSH